MLLDELLEFCDATALNTGAAGTYLVGDVVDLGAGSPDPGAGNGEPIYFVITIDTAVTSGGSATVQFILASDAQAAIATDGSATAHFTTSDIPKATLIAGYTVCAVSLPLGAPIYERYLGVLQVTGTAALTAGKINAFLTKDVAKWKAYADATN